MAEVDCKRGLGEFLFLFSGDERVAPDIASPFGIPTERDLMGFPLYHSLAAETA